MQYNALDSAFSIFVIPAPECLVSQISAAVVFFEKFAFGFLKGFVCAASVVVFRKAGKIVVG